MPLDIARRNSYSPRWIPTLLCAAGLAGVAAPSPARAAGNQDAIIMLHALSPIISKTACVRAENTPGTCAYFTAGVHNLALYPTTYYAYVLVARGDALNGVASTRFGIDYAGGANGATDGSGIEVYDWTPCGDLEFPTTASGSVRAWPNPNSGNIIVWDVSTNCQLSGSPELGVVAPAGFFYLASHEPATIQLGLHPTNGEATVGDCASRLDFIETCPNSNNFRFGALGFSLLGFNPACTQYCGTPVEETTWTGIKTLFR